ncbi:MAG: glutathione S-transferase C-terminal domain-containing protein [Candidatus Pelagadaptatus aseana]|uniref:glutathione S-transferase family protein n=1 Tax=Candidatus Pelagadaptatus aseana TaxID=3120508 RepID=UPI0039B1F55E
MIQLYTFPAAFGLRNVSPFCLKVEMALTHLGQAFEIVEESDPRKSPKGKLPYIVDGDVTVADSELILEYLDDKTGGQLFAGLSNAQKAQGVAYTRLAEEHLYWIMVASRWVDDGWWPNVAEGFFGRLPFPLKQLVCKVARNQVCKTYELQGLGKHSLEEQAGFARRDLQALDRAVAESDFLLGDAITAYDFAVASLLAGLIDNQPATWITPIAREYQALCDYTERVQQAVGVYARQ